MYTLIQPDDDGPVTFRTHVPLSGLSPEDARRILDSLGPLLSKLRERAAARRPEEASVVDLPAPEPGRSPTSRRSPETGRAREGGTGDAGAAGARGRAG